MGSKKQNKNPGVQLITYSDSTGKDLAELKQALDVHFQPAVKGVHILPFYPSSADRGFAPLTHRRIDERFGTEEDVRAISSGYELMADLIVNHVSKDSRYFQDYLEKYKRSKYHNFFIQARYFSRHWYKRPKSSFWRFFYYAFGQVSTILRNFDLVFHKHGVNRLVLKKIYRPRPGSPFVKYKFRNGRSSFFWCTFSSEQIDLNIHSPAVRRKFQRDIAHLADLGVKYLRLDAVGYAAKQRGTNNFLIPETINLIKWLGRQAHKHNMQIIPEVHFHYKTQIMLAEMEEVDYVYDFALPFLMLHALFFGNGYYLKEWLRVRPDNSLSNLDTHDGIGVVDVEDLLPPEEIKKASRIIYEKGGNATTRASGNNSDNVDVYQINCTYYSALGEDDQAYLAARAIQLFLPGIPQIYYVGMLAGSNDERLLEKTGHGRDVNRHYYSLEEIKEEKKRPVARELFELCRLRNEHPAFNGKYRLLDCEDHMIKIEWKNGKHKITLEVNLLSYETRIGK
jgi:sucrose phosphorylase